MNIKDKKIFSNFKNEDIDIKIDRKLNSRSRNQCPLNKLEKNNNDIDEDLQNSLEDKNEKKVVAKK